MVPNVMGRCHEAISYANMERRELNHRQQEDLLCTTSDFFWNGFKRAELQCMLPVRFVGSGVTAPCDYVCGNGRHRADIKGSDAGVVGFLAWNPTGVFAAVLPGLVGGVTGALGGVLTTPYAAYRRYPADIWIALWASHGAIGGAAAGAETAAVAIAQTGAALSLLPKAVLTGAAATLALPYALLAGTKQQARAAKVVDTPLPTSADLAKARNTQTLLLNPVATIPPEWAHVIDGYVFDVRELVAHIRETGKFVHPYTNAVFTRAELVALLHHPSHVAHTLSKLARRVTKHQPTRDLPGESFARCARASMGEAGAVGDGLYAAFRSGSGVPSLEAQLQPRPRRAAVAQEMPQPHGGTLGAPRPKHQQVR